MNVHCGQIETLVADLLDRRLDERQEAALREHLRHCEACRATWEPLIETIRLVERAPAPEAPAGLLGRVIGQLPAEPVAVPERPLPIQSFAARLGWITAAAAALLLAVLWPGTQQRMLTVDRPPVVLSSEVAPLALTCLAAGPATVPSGINSALMALAGATMAQQQARLVRAEPPRIVICMATPEPAAEAAGPSRMSDVLQMISNRAAISRGL